MFTYIFHQSLDNLIKKLFRIVLFMIERACSTRKSLPGIWRSLLSSLLSSSHLWRLLSCSRVHVPTTRRLRSLLSCPCPCPHLHIPTTCSMSSLQVWLLRDLVFVGAIEMGSSSSSRCGTRRDKLCHFVVGRRELPILFQGFFKWFRQLLLIWKKGEKVDWTV